MASKREIESWRRCSRCKQANRRVSRFCNYDKLYLLNEMLMFHVNIGNGASKSDGNVGGSSGGSGGNVSGSSGGSGTGTKQK